MRSFLLFQWRGEHGHDFEAVEFGLEKQADVFTNSEDDYLMKL